VARIVTLIDSPKTIRVSCLNDISQDQTINSLQ
jgi:hypothetical protein